MGAVVTRGPTLPFAGEPHLIGNAGRERFVYAPKADRFATGKRIGDRVVAGEVVGALGSTVVMAPLDGVLRGLTANGARVPEQFKIVEVDPRGEPALCFGLGERPLAIAHGVLRALTERGVADRPLCTADAS
jgi:xanthine dehydrogenase accessory factor